jgi:DNA polymerase
MGISERESMRAEAVDLVAAVRAFVAFHGDAGTLGFPRGPRRDGPSAEAAVTFSETTHVPPQAAAETPHARVTEQVVPQEPAPAPSPRPHRTLVMLQEEVASCTRCVLASTRTQTVFARGNPAAALCFVGEAPGADEDAQGVPFVGRAGQLLDKMIAAMGLRPEQDVYVCNIVKCRPPENRRPTDDEMSSCMPYLDEQLGLVRPRVIVALGNTAIGGLLGTAGRGGITKLRGTWKLYKGKTLVMPTYHPSYLLRPGPSQAAAKRQAWEDLQAVMRELGLPPPKTPARSP